MLAWCYHFWMGFRPILKQWRQQQQRQQQSQWQQRQWQQIQKRNTTKTTTTKAKTTSTKTKTTTTKTTNTKTTTMTMTLTRTDLRVQICDEFNDWDDESGLAEDGWYGESRSSYGQLETSNKLCKWTKLDLNPCQQNKLPGLWAVYNTIWRQILSEIKMNWQHGSSVPDLLAIYIQWIAVCDWHSCLWKVLETAQPFKVLPCKKFKWRSRRKNTEHQHIIDALA